MSTQTGIDPVTGKVERGARSLEKQSARERWLERRRREREFAHKPGPVEQAHSTLEELKSALHYARQAH